MCPLAAPAPGDGEIEAGFLQSGPAVVSVHAGPYDQLRETYAAMALDRRPRTAAWWSALGGLRHGSGDYPDPKDWRTEVCWPIERK